MFFIELNTPFKEELEVNLHRMYACFHDDKLTFRLFPIRMFSFGWFDYAGRVVSGYPSCFFLLLRYFFAFWRGEVSDVAEVDINLLGRGFAVLDRTFVNNDLADKGAQNDRCQFCYAGVFFG